MAKILCFLLHAQTRKLCKVWEWKTRKQIYVLLLLNSNSILTTKMKKQHPYSCHGHRTVINHCSGIVLHALVNHRLVSSHAVARPDSGKLLYQPYVRRSRNDRLDSEKTGQGVKDGETNMLHTLSLTLVSYKIYGSER
jgi:hypothetical protein